MIYSISDIAKIVGATYVLQDDITQVVSILLTDSRQLSIPSQTLFFALSGYRRDGHDYIVELINSGVRHFVVSDESTITDYVGVNVLKVENVLVALQTLASYHRQRFKIPILGITGSNGKTMVKEWLSSILNSKLTIHRSPKSYNSQIGVPLSVWDLDENHDLGIFEAGISLPQEMNKLERIIRPTVGLITNIGSAHDAGFESRQHKLDEKLALFKSVQSLIYCKDHIQIDEAIQKLGIPSISWGQSTDADMVYTISKGVIRVLYKEKTWTFNCENEESYLIENYLSCIAYCLVMSIELHSNVLLHLPSIEMRTQLIKGENNCLIVQDAYSADLSSLAQVLAYCKRNRGQREMIVVMTDILQSGRAINDLYRQIAEILSSHDVQKVYAIGDDIAELSNHYPTEHFVSVLDFQQYLSRLEWRDKLVLLKGARKFKLEMVVKQLQEKYHETFLEVNMGAVARNYKTLERFIAKDSKILVMVKANAYGAGVDQLASFFESRQIDYFGVAYIDEGVQLRKLGINNAVLVLNPDRSGFDQLVEHNLEPEIFSFELLSSFINYCKAKGISEYPIHIKLETGMNRLGFSADHLEDLVVMLKNSTEVKVVGLMSHLAASDDLNEDRFTLGQIALFKKLCFSITSALAINPIKHLLNSHAIVNYPEHCMDMVRLGIGIYGYLANSSSKVILESSHTLKARISQIKELKKGDTIGYSRKSLAYDGQRIAIISIGYADGLFRLAGNGRFKVYVKNRFLPIVGNVCMDMCMIDVTDVDDIKVRDEVEIFGINNPIENLANACMTIPYEILTSISDRVTRIYLDD